MTGQILQILGLILVVFGFAGLVLWTYAPGNRARFEAGSRLPLDQPADAGELDNSGRSDR